MTLVVDENILPSVANETFEQTSFFRWYHGKALPTPQEVRNRAATCGHNLSKIRRPDPVRFPELKLLVKWGSDVTVAEGQCIWFLRERCGDEVPVPEIYGWRSDGDVTFLYMELVHGDTLETRWPTLATCDREEICRQLQDMVKCLRRLKRKDHPDSICKSYIYLLVNLFICLFQTFPGQIGGQSIRDIMFSDAGAYPAGPFPNVAAFHDAFARLVLKKSSPQEDPRRDIRGLSGLVDDMEVVFTHNDLAQSNILISKPGDGQTRIIALIDWHQSGWYPEPWEWLKAFIVAYPGSDWRDYIGPLQQAKYEYYYAWNYVIMSIVGSAVPREDTIIP